MDDKLRCAKVLKRKEKMSRILPGKMTFAEALEYMKVGYTASYGMLGRRIGVISLKAMKSTMFVTYHSNGVIKPYFLEYNDVVANDWYVMRPSG